MAWGGNVSSNEMNQHKMMAGAACKTDFGVGDYPGKRSGGQITPMTGNAMLSDSERSGKMTDSMGKDRSRRDAKA